MTIRGFESESPEDEFVTIRVFANEIEFLLARSVLESAGIECFVPNEHTMEMTGLLPSVPWYGYTLQVHKPDAKDALAILDASAPDENKTKD